MTKLKATIPIKVETKRLCKIKLLFILIDIMKTLSKSIYHISSNEEPACSAGKDLFILNYDALEVRMRFADL